MARYVEGFLIPVPKRKFDAYRRMARKAGRIWREHGAHRGPALPGLAADRHGYVPIDGDCRVPGAENVWAAGDCTSLALKHSTLAVAQAECAAAAIRRCCRGEARAAGRGARCSPESW